MAVDSAPHKRDKRARVGNVAVTILEGQFPKKKRKAEILCARDVMVQTKTASIN